MRYAAAYMYVGLMIIGLYGILTRADRKRLILPAGVAGYLLLVLILSELRVRHRMPLEIILVPYASVVLVSSVKAAVSKAGRLRSFPGEMGVYIREIPRRLKE